MKGQMTDKIRVQHILDAITEIEKYHIIEVYLLKFSFKLRKAISDC